MSTPSLRFVPIALMAALFTMLGAPVQAAPATPYRVATGLEGSLSEAPIALGDQIFWLSYGNNQTSSQDIDLWTSDGTSAGTTEFVDPNPGGDARVTQLEKFGDGLVFLADDGVHGHELWHSDGTVDGTEMVADLDPEADGNGTTHILGVSPAAVYLSADDGVHGDELYRWTGSGTPTLLDINTTARAAGVGELEDQWDTSWTDSRPDRVGILGDDLIFSADDTLRTPFQQDGDWYVGTSGHGRELWRVGPTGSPGLAKDITPGNEPGWGDEPSGTRFDHSSAAAMGGRLYFVVTTDLGAPDLWRTNGTPGGTDLVAHDFPVSWNTDTTRWDFEPTVAGGQLFYSSWTEGGGYDGLWATAGSGAGSRVGPAGAVGDVMALNGKVVFGLSQSGTGSEPWITDGSSASLLKDIVSGAASSSPYQMYAWRGHVYFSANGASGRDLYRTDGATGGTELVYDLPNQVSYLGGPLSMVGADGVLYFFHSPTPNLYDAYELWAFDPDRVAVKKATVKLTAPSPIVYGSGPKVTVAVTGVGGTPTGTVTFKDGAAVIGTAALVGGKARLALPRKLSVGTHRLTAVYSGDGTFGTATSKVVNVVVKADTKLKGKVNDLTFTTKEKPRVNAVLVTTPMIKATGTLTVLVDGKKKASVALKAKNKNKASLNLKPLAKGKHTIQVTFTKSPNAMDAKTGTITIKVVKP